MKKITFEKKLKKLVARCNVKVFSIDYMCGCTTEGDFGTYRVGFGITIEGSEDDAWMLKNNLEEWLDDYSLDFCYGEQTASDDLNHDLEDESYNYSHVIVMLGRGQRFEN